MTTEQGPSLAELDEVLSRAIDRQIAEQRALRQSLEDLQEAVRRASERQETIVAPAPQIDVLAIGDSVRDSVRLAIDTGIARLEKALRDIRAELGPAIDDVSSAAGAIASVRTLTEGLSTDVRSVAEGVGGAAADVQGIAAALIDFNAGLRGWADDMEKGVAAIRQAVEASATAKPMQPDESRARLEAMQKQLKDTADLSLYLTDQIEDLDAVLNKLGDLPDKIEGVVTQGMRRTLTARAKIEQDASSVLDDVAGSLEVSVDRLSEVLDVFEGGDIRRIQLAQVELGSRMESMQATLQDRIQEIEAGNAQTLEALARAIDRFARGQEPQALESVAKANVQRRAKATKAKATKPKKATAKAKGTRSRRTRADDSE